MSEVTEHDKALMEFQARQHGQLSPLWVLGVLLRERRRILYAGGIGALVGLLVALLRPPTYTTTFSFTPQAGEGGDRGGLASLAGQFGVSLGGLAGQAQTPEFYADLLSTREILGPVVRDSFRVPVEEDTTFVRLPDFLGEDGPSDAIIVENTLKKLREKVVKAEVAGTGTGVVTVSVRTKSREVSQQIAERLLEEMHRFNLNVAQAQAAAEREFLEGRLQEARVLLRAAEDAMQGFLQANRQVANSPELTFRLERLQREVSLHQQLTLGLAQQYEEARIREVRDTPVLSVVERPVPAARTDPRKRLLTLAAFVTMAVLIAMAYVLTRSAVAHLTLDGRDPGAPIIAAEWERLTGRTR